MKILEKNDERISFLVEGINPAMAGELRRIMMVEIPTLAIEWVDFLKNDSILWDEIIASRLGLIPLTFDPKMYKFKDDCQCEGKGCSHCQVTLVLKKKGPGMVYSGDMVSSDKEVKPVYDKIPIINLREDQSLEFEAIAQVGIGKEHAKWQASIVGYKMVPKIAIGKDANKKDFLDRCPRGVFEFKDGKLTVKNLLDCNTCLQCVELSEGGIKIEPDETKYVFKVETTSGIKPEKIFLKAIDVLEGKLTDFSKDLSKLK